MNAQKVHKSCVPAHKITQTATLCAVNKVRTHVSASKITPTAKSRKVLNIPPVTMFPYQNLPQICEVLVVAKAWLGRDSRYKLTENILVSYSYGFELMVLVAENKLVLE